MNNPMHITDTMSPEVDPNELIADEFASNVMIYTTSNVNTHLTIVCIGHQTGHRIAVGLTPEQATDLAAELITTAAFLAARASIE